MSWISKNTTIPICRIGARTRSRLIELSEDSIGRSLLFIYCSGDRGSCIAIASSAVATDMVAESSAQDDHLLLPRSALQGLYSLLK
jgi:hypothetical protein